MSLVSSSRLSAHLGVAASAYKTRRLHLSIECYWQNAQGLSVLLEPSRMERGERVGQGKKGQMGLQSLKLTSIVCSGRRQLLSEFTVLRGKLPQTASPLSFPSQTHLCLWCLRWFLFFLFYFCLSRSININVTMKGNSQNTVYIIFYIIVKIIFCLFNICCQIREPHGEFTKKKHISHS